jgi:3-methylcrotonyl-CoA carboxylase beta subunit
MHIIYGCSPRFLWTWPNARVSVMGGEQAANVLTQITRDARHKKGLAWSKAEEEAFRRPLLEQYERESHALYASARLWDDGIIIEPGETRTLLARALSLHCTIDGDDRRDSGGDWGKFGVFRM